MVHVAGHDSGELEYADHEVQIVGMRFNVPTDSGPNAIGKGVDQKEPVSQRGLDSDELAELVAMYRSANLVIDSEDEGSQTFVGSAEVESNLGINLSGPSEFPTDLFTNSSTSENLPDDGDASAFTFNENDPGVLDYHAMHAEPGFISGTEGAGGPGQETGPSERFINFRDNFGSGPYLDRTDDLTVASEIETIEVTGNVKYEVIYTLYWNVEEMPEGRASFARP